MSLGARIVSVVAVTVLLLVGLPAVADPIDEEQASASHSHEGEAIVPLDEDDDEAFLEGTERLTPYRGDLHAHTAYSDGEDTPERAFQDASREPWLDFFAVTDHSDWLLFPFKADTDCIGTQAPSCYVSPLPERTEWGDMGHQAQRFTGEDFLAMRGFEWSSQIEGHVNVYDTRVWTDAEQTGHAPMTGFYGWMAGEQLDADRWATFNHPGREPLMFDDFAYVPQMDPFLVSLESFNRDDDYSDTYLQALDEGWHVGTHGVTDGHGTTDRIDELRGHTVALMDAFTKDGLRRSMAQHHTVAIQGSDQDARFRVDGYLMGDTVPDPGPFVQIEAELLDAGRTGPTSFETVELLGPEGWQRTLAIGEGAPCEREVEDGVETVACETALNLDELGTTALGEHYLVLRAHQAYDGHVRPTVVTSAVWLQAG